MTTRKENRMNRKPRATPPTNPGYIDFSTPLSLIGTSGEIHDLKEFRSVIDRFIQIGTKQFLERIDDAVKAQKLSKRDAEDYYAFHEDEYDRWHSSFPNTIRSTMLIAACSRFETALSSLCLEIEKLRIPDLYSWDSIVKHKGIRRGAYFLCKNIGVCPQEHPLWSRVLDYYTIRDCFVHAGGILDMMKPTKRIEIRSAIRRLRDYGVSENAVYQIELSQEFFKIMFDDMIKFWQDLEKAMKQNAVVGPRYFP